MPSFAVTCTMLTILTFSFAISFSNLISIDLPGLFRSDGSLGGLVRNDTFILSGSDYSVNRTIIVAEDGHLVIGPNTTLSFASGRGILVGGSGKLSIDGPSLLDSSEAPGNWFGILLRNFNNTSIRGAVIRHAENGVRSSSTGDLAIEDTAIESASSDGILLESTSTSSVMLSNLRIESPGSDGIYAANFRGTFNMTNSSIDGGYWGIYSTYASSISLMDNRLEGQAEKKN